MALMYNPQPWDNPNAYFKYGWRYVYAPSAHELADYVSKYRVMTACVKKGIRLQKNFMFAEWLPIDVDDGLSLAYALNHLKDYIHVIGTTKSHQKPKNDKPACDRYRVFLRLEDRTYNLDDYEYTAKKWAKLFQADDAVTGGHSMLCPCKPVSIKYYGQLVSLVDGAWEKQKLMKAYKGKMDGYGNKVIPSWIKVLLDYGQPNNRNNTGIKVALTLVECGFSHDQILDIIMNSKMAKGGAHPYTKAECELSIKSAFRRTSPKKPITF